MALAVDPSAPVASDAPAAQYHARIAGERAQLAAQRARHRAVVWIRIAVLVVAILGGAGVLGAPLWPATAGVVGFVALTVWIIALEDRLRRGERRVAYFEAGLARLADRWLDTTERGECYVDPHHLYAGDLDLFGRGGLFGLLCMARTQAGKDRLAAWLLAATAAASPEARRAFADEVAARQAAVRELAPLLDLREAMFEAGRRIERDVQPDRLTAWLTAALRPAGAAVRFLGFVLGLAAIPALLLLLSGHPAFALAIYAAQATFVHRHRGLTADVTARAARRARELRTVSRLVSLLEAAPFTSASLRALQRQLTGDAAVAPPARARVGRLIWFVELLEARLNLYFAISSAPFLLGTQLALAVEAWRRRHGALAAQWVDTVATIEALASLATFHFDRPDHAFPDVLATATAPTFVARDLGHPLVPAATRITNDVDLGYHRLLLITGSNMSGKSTLLRAVGINTILALTGAPVCARSLTVTPLAVGATLRTSDSIHEGVSRFFAEIRRLRDVVALTDTTPFTLYLLDEILSGTNSHDRQRGCAAIVRTLVTRGALGLVTTHDLALTQLADALAPLATNAHFQDRIDGDRLVFDYTLRPGIVTRSNALDLMRLVGLDV